MGVTNLAESERLTVCVVSRNEAELLDDCLAQVGWADEIIVLDMQSTDKTRDVAAARGARVIPVPLVPIAERIRQVGLEAARNSWVLHLDPDERAPAALQHEWSRVVRTTEDCAAVRWPFVDVSFGSPTPRLSRGSAKLVLFSRDRVQFSASANAHEEPAISGTIGSGLGRTPIEHHGLRSTQQAVEKLMRYALLGAVFEPDVALRDVALARLWFRYVVRTGGWRDGPSGVQAASLLAIHDYVGSLVKRESEGLPPIPLSPATRTVLAATSRLAGAVIGGRSVLQRWSGR